MEIDAKTLDRIRKLLALANDGGATEAEAALAMQLAQEKMAEFNLSAAMFEAQGGEKEGRAREFSRLPLLYRWKRELLETLAKVNYCYLDIATDLKSYHIIGRKSNIAATHHMFEYLTQTLERLLVAEVGTSPQARYNKWSHSFRLGCSSRLIERLRVRHEQQLAEQEQKAREERARASHPAYAGGNALVVVMRDFAQEEADLNNDMRMGWMPGTTAERRARWQAEFEQRRAAYAARRDELVAQGYDREIAGYMASGFSEEKAKELADPKPAKPETEAQRKRREEKEEREWQRQQERDERRARKINLDGFRAGARRADEIGLDAQVGNDGTRRVR